MTINLYSIAELIDKLIIENIKIFNLREKLHQENIDSAEYVAIENKMNIVNENRGVLIDFLNDKIFAVFQNGETNSFLKNVKTYEKPK